MSSMIFGSGKARVNIVNPGILNIQNKKLTVEKIESVMNATYYALMINLQEFDLTTEEGYREAQQYAYKNKKKISKLATFIYLLYKGAEKTKEHFEKIRN